MSSLSLSNSSLESEVKSLQSEMETIVTRFQNTQLPAQKKNLECAMNCFTKFPINNPSDRDELSTSKAFEGVSKCVDMCSKPFQELQNVAQKEFSGVQNTLSNCQRSCQTQIAPQLQAIQSGLGTMPSESEQANMKLQMEQCAGQCIQTAKSQLPGLETRLDGYIKNVVMASGA